MMLDIGQTDHLTDMVDCRAIRETYNPSHHIDLRIVGLNDRQGKCPTREKAFPSFVSDFDRRYLTFEGCS